MSWACAHISTEPLRSLFTPRSGIIGPAWDFEPSGHLEVNIFLCPASCVLSPVPRVLRPASYVLRPTSYVLRPVSRVMCAVPCVLRPASCVLCPASCVLRPASSLCVCVWRGGLGQGARGPRRGARDGAAGAAALIGELERSSQPKLR